MSSSTKALKKYQELICNFQKRNRDLLFKGSPMSIPLSHLTVPKECPEPAKLRSLFQPARLSNPQFVEAINSGKLILDEHFHLKYENLALRRKINYLRNADDSFQKEYGISGAWFVGPFLMWRTKEMTDEADNIFISPILKNPIDIKKNKSKNDLIEFEEACLHTINPTLKILLKKEYGVDLEKDYTGTLKEVMDIISTKFHESKIILNWNSPDGDLFKIGAKSKSIEDENGEKIRVKIPIEERYVPTDLELLKSITTAEFLVQDVFYLDVFNASKMSLYYDYEEIIEKSMTEAPKLISSLIDENVYLDENELSQSSCESENFYVVDIDGSQHSAIKKCEENEGFVIQGPPGTGKSQTITNLISQLLAQGKKVLFVAEKRPALDVVYSRLCSSGLGKHSVILHDNEVNKNALYKSYVEAFQEKVDGAVSEKWDDITETLNLQTKNVSAYFNDLQQISTSSNMKNVDFLAMFAKSSKVEISNSLYNYLSPLTWPQLNKAKSLIQDTQKLYTSFGRYESTFWKYLKESEVVNDLRIKAYQEMKEDFDSNAANYETSYKQLVSNFPEGDLTAIGDIKEDIPAVSDFEVAALMVNNYLNTSNAKILLLELKDKVSSLKGKLSSFKMVKAEATIDKVKILEDYFSKPKSIFKYLSFKYWKMVSLGKTVIDDKRQLENHAIYKDWIVFNEFEQNISESIDLVYRSVKMSFQDKEGQLKSLDDHLIFANFILRLKTSIGGKRFLTDFSGAALKSVVKDFSDSKQLSELCTLSNNAMTDIKERVDSAFEVKLSEKLQNYGAILSDLISSKQDIPSVQNIRTNLKELERVLSLKKFEDWALTLTKDKKPWWETLAYHSMSVIKDKIFTDFPQIRLFSSEKIEDDIIKLNDLFDYHKRMSRSAVDYQVGQSRLKTPVPQKISKMIENEANKTRRIKSPREVMENGALDVMLEWKRCWLMSPLSISQILPNSMNLFDVVIFDEASQVKLEDAIPSIYRAKSLIVVGDNKQMPPTNFFGGGYDDDDEEDFEIAESLLDQAAKKYPSLMLEWHYRSEAESLIAFSNFAYYEGRLIVPPNPGTLCSSGALDFVSVSEGVFDSKNGNEIEARLIVEEVRDILLNNQKASVGVISMGASQQKAISKIIEELTEVDEKFAQALQFSLNYYEDGSYKGFFNRNLENVQGDERDTILLSVGYGQNKTGKLIKNFGPLIKEGGGRRLNVAITRARKKMKVYCSFNPSDLSIDDTAYMKNPNATTFARFLAYAKHVSDNDETTALQILNSFSNVKSIGIEENQFRSHVAAELSALGFKVREGIGNCGFVIDIGIFSDRKQEEFILGIDINRGVKRDSEFLRDSFKNRDSLLRNRGWTIYSLWMQDWIDDKDTVIQEIQAFISTEIKKIA